MLKSTLLLFALTMSATAGHAADNCEPLRARIEAQIAGTGVTGFTVTTLDAAADVPGKVVGSCGNGAKKIVYARGSTAPVVRAVAPAAQALAPPVTPKPRLTKKATRDEDMLTECKDGTVSRGGSCKP
ncbi:MAG: DUF1161 domain-containing protein [Hydrogenophaga sp.]|jgi:hypothetical protein|uniref:DUF1161 domain-containing protein n=1 Tax=Hydrogenophaga sp. TaxID=1904254 RepID=UPI002716F51E|nr:DUF1161 domain-containing protein [Hydrogenophaga sp.]MDO9146279.1 DUF1161 domain-containing protein [Hydrogenophaga sp.]MDO9481967.1 DUF1161 domain-containing protein [Hydrogenophaga sp.]MDO9604710.1 DUF1161 domain-containing protein [Hydrogenophaga sp.]MDP3478051.1 DUF1161 domain-containing protein [Hydrogenophaga sp.]